MTTLSVRRFRATSGPAPHPSVVLQLSTNFKIIGGGAQIQQQPPWGRPEAGNFLTASYPLGLQTWVAAGKDHEVSDPEQIVVEVIAIDDPQNEWDVTIVSQTSDPTSHPQAIAVLPRDPSYILTGGGAFVDYKGAGNLLTASCPNFNFGGDTSDTSWLARSKDHGVPDPCAITAYAIGLRHRAGTVSLDREIIVSTGPVLDHPFASAAIDSEYILSGGGAYDDWSGEGNLLTGSVPDSDRDELHWTAAGRDHLWLSPAKIIAFAIGIRIPPV
jgi:hypothetical protein